MKQSFMYEFFCVGGCDLIFYRLFSSSLVDSDSSYSVVMIVMILTLLKGVVVVFTLNFSFSTKLCVHESGDFTKERFQWM